jgi:hypothetical protein
MLNFGRSKPFEDFKAGWRDHFDIAEVIGKFRPLKESDYEEKGVYELHDEFLRETGSILVAHPRYIAASRRFSSL